MQIRTRGSVPAVPLNSTWRQSLYWVDTARPGSAVRSARQAGPPRDAPVRLLRMPDRAVTRLPGGLRGGATTSARGAIGGARRRDPAACASLVPPQRAGRWHRGRRSSRRTTPPLDVSRGSCERRGRGSDPGAGCSRREDLAGGRAGRRAGYAASAFRYAVMQIIMSGPGPRHRRRCERHRSLGHCSAPARTGLSRSRRWRRRGRGRTPGTSRRSRRRASRRGGVRCGFPSRGSGPGGYG